MASVRMLLLAVVVALLSLLSCASANESHDRRMRARVNFKGDKVGHSNYGRGQDERRKLVEQKLAAQKMENAAPPQAEDLDVVYFKMHDRDGNNMLDGTELVRMLLEDTNSEEYDEEVLRLMLEHLLEEDDINWDGYIDFAEFKKSESQHVEP